jgi:hypothetical protein
MYALDILREIELRSRPDLLAKYFANRGIDHVPPTAFGGRFDGTQHRKLTDPCFAFEVTDGLNAFGCAITWLDPTMSKKRDPRFGPQRNFYGPIKGGYVTLYQGDLDPNSKLIIAEGVETAMAASQLSRDRLPAIAALSASNLPDITPPLAKEYIICADHDPAGIAGARALAAILVRKGQIVRLEIPPIPGKDFNDVLKERLGL